MEVWLEVTVNCKTWLAPRLLLTREFKAVGGRLLGVGGGELGIKLLYKVAIISRW